MLKIIKQRNLDAQVLKNLQELSSPGEEKPFLDEMIDTFLEHTPQLIVDLKNAMEKHDARAVEHYAHKLKGFGRNLGAINLSQLCDAIETNSAKISKSEVPQLFAELETSYQDAVKELLKDWRTAA